MFDKIGLALNSEKMIDYLAISLKTSGDEDIVENALLGTKLSMFFGQLMMDKFRIAKEKSSSVVITTPRRHLVMFSVLMWIVSPQWRKNTVDSTNKVSDV